MTAVSRFPRFFVTAPGPCPYLEGKQERKIFTELSGGHALDLNDALSRIGFRRSQAVAYRPSCANCAACVSVRVVAGGFEPNATQRKTLKRHSDLEITACKPWASDEQFALLQRYLSARHPDGGMVQMDETDYADMIEQSPVNTYVIEYREPSVGARPGKLVGACLTDQHGDGLSMIYSFFDTGPDARQGLGNFIIMEHILRAQRAGLPYVYLGYWVKGSQRMAYKARYRPLEVLGPAGWSLLTDEELEISMPLSDAMAKALA